MKKIVLICLGVICLSIGTVAAAVPMLPSFPFLLVAAICFAKSSERLHTWFIGTKLYRDNLESYVKGEGMTRKSKIRIMGIVTLTMAFGFAMMGKVPLGRKVLVVVWIFHILYFIFGIKTARKTEDFGKNDL